MDVASLVKSITSAFEDASRLVDRIRRQNSDDPNAHLDSIDDLLRSLSLGPTVVRGYYESDAKRFGSIYTTGDPAAREELKDALISLQFTVLSGLQTVILNQTDPDYDAIQTASDDCRVNVGVCLGQLSQRVSKAAKGMSSSGKMHIYDNPTTKPVHRSNSHSTTSSGHTKTNPITPPESDTEYLADTGTVTTARRQNFTARGPGFDAMDGMHSSSYSGLYATQDNSGHVPHRLSTGPLTRPLESPVSPQDLLPNGQHRIRDSTISTMSAPRHNSLYQPQTSQDGFGLGGSQDSSGDTNAWGYFSNQMNEAPRINPYSDLTSATLGKSRVSPSLVPVNRKPISAPHSGTLVSSPKLVPAYQRHSIPEEVEKEVYIPPALPMRSESRPDSYSGPSTFYGPDSIQRPDPIPQMSTHTRSDSFALSGTLGRVEPLSMASTLPRGSDALSVASTLPRGSDASTFSSNLHRNDSVARTMSMGPLVLPSEKNLLGFCKGAFRLQIGIEKKAFSIANRPLGYSSMIQYWKCEKCYFEGPCSTLSPPGAKKPEKTFDPIIRDHSGIRYKWAFLAKCHVPLKSMPEGKRDGSYGSFSCIFCVAEAAHRGWSIGPATLSSDRSSIKSGNSGGSSNTSGTTPVFGNIHGFMDHLQIHRQTEYWPGIEMQFRMKCVVGRFAPRNEPFDINLTPIVAVEM